MIDSVVFRLLSDASEIFSFFLSIVPPIIFLVIVQGGRLSWLYQYITIVSYVMWLLYVVVRVYCTWCVRRLAGSAGEQFVQESDPWLCYFCQPHTESVRGLLSPRVDWRDRIIRLFQPPDVPQVDWFFTLHDCLFHSQLKPNFSANLSHHRLFLFPQDWLHGNFVLLLLLRFFFVLNIFLLFFFFIAQCGRLSWLSC